LARRDTRRGTYSCRRSTPSCRRNIAMTVRDSRLANADLPMVGLRRASRFALLGFLAAGAVAAWHWRTILDPATIGAAIGRYPTAPLGFLVVHIAASLLFIPRTLLAIVAGLLFGVGWGIVWAASGSVAGAVAGFLAARHLSSGLGDLGRFGAIAARVERGGWGALGMLPWIPIIPLSVRNFN